MDVNKFKDTVEGQIRHTIPGAGFTWRPVGELDECLPSFLLYITAPHGSRSEASMILLMISERNITWRRPEKEDNATWRIPGESANLLAMSDAVVVSYGPAADGGEIWEESSGNDRKGSYRRLAYSRDVTKHPTLGCFNEILTVFSENNICRMWGGLPLEDICDYSSKRYKRER